MVPGRLLARMSTAPALLLAAWLLVAMPLLLAGVFRPVPAIGLFLPVAGVVCWYGARHVPERITAPWWTVTGVVAVAACFGVVQALMASEQIVVRRDAASYAQFTVWLAKHGSLPIPRSAGVFGHDAWVSYASPAFYERAGEIVPQFMAGLPLALAPGHWIAGMTGVLLGAPALGAAGVLTFGGLVARLAGPRWAPLGALTLAVCLPMMYVSRSTYSEAAALILLVGGLAALVDALDLRGRPARVRAGLAGVVLGLAVLVRIDALRDVLPLVAYVGVLATARSSLARLALPLGTGLSAGVGYGLVEGYVLSRPYLEHLAPALKPLLWMSGGVVVATAVGVGVARFVVPRLPCSSSLGLSRLRLPEVGGALVLLTVAGFAVRPWLQETHTDTPATARFIGSLQRYYGLPVDPTRLYYENSLYWLVWYVGLPTVLLATFAAALLVWFAARGRAPRWIPVLSVLLWTTATVLWYPGITPDHPWASRRFASLVVPAMVLLAVWAVACLARLSRRAAGRRRVASYVRKAVAGGGCVAMVVPPLMLAFPLLATPVEQGETAAVQGVCRSLRPDAAVVFVDPLSASRFLQVVRGMCSVPTAAVTEPTSRKVAEVAKHIVASGRRPVLASWEAETLRRYVPRGGWTRPMRVLQLETTRDTSTLVQPPSGTMTLDMSLWLAKPLTTDSGGPKPAGVPAQPARAGR